MNNDTYRATLEKSATVYVQKTLSDYMGTKTKTLDSNQAIAELSQRLVDRFIDTLPEGFTPAADYIDQDFLTWCEQNAAVIAQIDRVTVSRTVVMGDGNSITVGVTADRYPDMDLIATRAWLDLAIVKMLPQAINAKQIGAVSGTTNRQASSTHNLNSNPLIETLQVDELCLSATLKGQPVIRFFGGQWQKFGVPLYLDDDRAKELYRLVQDDGATLNERRGCKGTVKVIMEGDKPLKVSSFELITG
jgi:hypothetical protein